MNMPNWLLNMAFLWGPVDAVAVRGSPTLQMPMKTPSSTSVSDPINHPSHYQSGSIEVIDVIEAFGLGPHEANIVKYVLRYKKKNGRQDLLKAQWYLNRLIDRTA